MTPKLTPNDLRESPLPETNLVWNLYGAGFERLGDNGLPEEEPLKSPREDQLLVRIDAVGICYSDVKLIQQGENHPKLAGIDLGKNPTRPGHEISLTVIKVGKDLHNLFKPGQRYAVLPEVVHNNKKMTYGFDLHGGLSQFDLMGPELLDTDFGISLLEITDKLSFAEASILEPWGSVLSSYDPDTRRVKPKINGSMWIIGRQGAASEYVFSRYLGLPDRIIITDVNPSLEKALRNGSKNILKRDQVAIEDYQTIVAECTGGRGFDDIVVIDPLSSDQIESLLTAAARGGVVNLVGRERLRNRARVDAQRIHYDFISIIGNPGPDLSASYGLNRNRSRFLPGGTAAMIGAAGPMGQMHLHYAILDPNGPGQIIVTDLNQERLSHLENRFLKLAEEQDKSLYLINPADSPEKLPERIFHLIGKSSVDDVILLAPGQEAMEAAASLLHENSLINLFAGTPKGVCLPLDLAHIYLGNLRVTGSSGLSMKHLVMAYDLAQNGDIEIKSSIAAVGGLYAAAEAIKAVEEGRFSGKIIIYPQLPGLPLIALDELVDKYAIGDSLGKGNISDLRLIEEKLLAEYIK